MRFARSTLRLDDDDALRLARIDPAEALRGDTPRLVDEWQNAPHLWNRIRRECDERALPGQFLAGLVVVTALGPAYRRPDGVHVVPITALGP